MEAAPVLRRRLPCQPLEPPAESGDVEVAHLLGHLRHATLAGFEPGLLAGKATAPLIQFGIEYYRAPPFGNGSPDSA